MTVVWSLLISNTGGIITGIIIIVTLVIVAAVIEGMME